MRKTQVEVGKAYIVKVSGELRTVKILGESPYGGWIGRNLATGRDVRIKTAGRLRREATSTPAGLVVRVATDADRERWPGATHMFADANTEAPLWEGEDVDDAVTALDRATR